MMPVRNYRDLIAWQKAMDLVASVDDATKTFPRDELFGLASQMRRAVVSIPCNIAEGQAAIQRESSYIFFRLRVARFPN